MYIEKINCLASDIEEIKKAIKTNRKEINKRRKILSMTDDEKLETDIIMYLDEIENLKKLLQTKKQLLKNYKKL